MLRLLLFLFSTATLACLHKYFFKGLTLTLVLAYSIETIILVNILSNIEFIGVNFLLGEAVLHVLVLGLNLGAFIFRERSSNVKENTTITVPLIPLWFLVLVLLSFIFFILLLSDFQFNTLLDPIQLKHRRLYLTLVEKNFNLFLAESFFLASVTLSIVWSVFLLDYTRKYFAFSFFIIVIYLFTTGARSPIVGFLFLVIISFYVSSSFSTKARKYYKFIKNNSIRIIALCFGIIYLTTLKRIDFEGLSPDVFTMYFQISSYGNLYDGSNEVSPLMFTLITIFVYLTSTVANFTLKVTEGFNIIHTFGYNFIFPYLSVLKSVWPGVQKLQALNESNNLRLLNYSDSATQWSTVFGDLVWDFGLVFSLLLLVIVSYLIRGINYVRTLTFTLEGALLKVYLFSLVIVPLVSPFSSIQFHLVLILLAFLRLANSLKMAPFKYKRFFIYRRRCLVR